MAMNRVQYQAGLLMFEFFENSGTHEQCEDFVRAWRWPRGFVCPRCAETSHSEFRRDQRVYFQCSACRYQCSLVSGTVFESSHPGQEQRLRAGAVKHKLMEVMQLREQDRRLTGRVQIDDAYLGGELSGGQARPRLAQQGRVHRRRANHRVPDQESICGTTH